MTTPTQPNAVDEEDQSDQSDTSSIPGGIEREVLGKWTVFLRNLGGIIAVMVVCGMGVFNSYTIHISVSLNKVWPSEMSMFIMVVGPVICSWTFMNSSKTISTLMQIKGMGNRVRNSLANVLATDDGKKKAE